MTLGALIAAARTLAPDARARVDQAGRQSAKVTGVAHDSRGVSTGSVFVAIRGQRADGTKFAADAASRGAVAIVAETAPPPGIVVLVLVEPVVLVVATVVLVWPGRVVVVVVVVVGPVVLVVVTPPGDRMFSVPAIVVGCRLQWYSFV